MPLQKSPQTREPKEFSGNFLTSANGIFLIVLIAGFIWLFCTDWLKHRDTGNLIALLIPLFGFYIGIAFNLFYFRIADGCLEIRNHVFPWFARKYPLEEIDSVIIAIGEWKRSDGLRLKRKAGSWSWTYAAGSLRRRHWQALAQALRKRNVSVDNRL